MGHYKKLEPVIHYYVPVGGFVFHRYNGGVKHRRSRVYKEVPVTLMLIYWPKKRWPYSTVDGVLRRNPKTLTTWQRQQGTARSDARRARRQQKGLRDVVRSQAYRSGEVDGTSRLRVDGL